MVPTPSIFTMRFMVSLPAFLESVFESTCAQERPFSHLDRSRWFHLASVLPPFQCAVVFPSGVLCQPSCAVPHLFGQYFAGSGRTGPRAHLLEATDSGCSAIQVQVAPCLHDLTLIPPSDM